MAWQGLGTSASASALSSAASKGPSLVSFKAWDPELAAVRRRSAQLMADPKARELTHFVGSRRHEARLREAAGFDGEDVHEAAVAAKVVMEISGQEDKAERFDPMCGCKARLEWRAEMDRNIRRLLQDADLMLDDRMQERTKHNLRCEHLDKTYDWFGKHGKKEASKERPAPPFIRFEYTNPVMPGSLRRNLITAPALALTSGRGPAASSLAIGGKSPFLATAGAMLSGGGAA
eukprot:CAMPEP_0198498420 /NCGR_PEP_ID=MMETSP1462-20131121/6998_1 /TAXON_ID=1333877 /ORGANISM="Brandtodinium nutriculum, Strain RCC3387" /LENGTH=232 /DNA_ID=CAMNT_0044227337 /DNA_START=65 /DNA_END=759 /DNA_ORIENTATION=+